MQAIHILDGDVYNVLLPVSLRIAQSTCSACTSSCASASGGEGTSIIAKIMRSGHLLHIPGVSEEALAAHGRSQVARL